MTLPVIGKVNVTIHLYKVHYEGLHIIYSRCVYYGHQTRDCHNTLDNPMQSVVPMVAQPRGLPKNVVHEQSLLELHKEVCNYSAKIIAKDFGYEVDRMLHHDLQCYFKNSDKKT